MGAGPSGFYAAGQLLAVDDPEFAVDLYDRLPTPYGLVRSGVAPDHPKIKSVTRAYDKTTKHARFRFFGHVELGGDITRRQLLEHYHVVLYTLGTSIDRRLGIPGEELRGSHAATEFVAWYNGHPDHCGLEVDLQAQAGGRRRSRQRRDRRRADARAGTVGACGHRHCRPRDRGARGLEHRGDHDPRSPWAAAGGVHESRAARDGRARARRRRDRRRRAGRAVGVALEEADKTRRRNVEILQEYAARPKTGKPITVRFRFLASPVELLGDENGHVRAVKIEKNAIVARDDGSLAARGTGTFDELPAQLVFRSIGYTGQPIGDIPFDERRGLIRNEGGRVTDPDGTHQLGEYVSGWIKRGPSGVIGTNKKDSQDTVNKILEDVAAGRVNEPISDDIEALIEACAPDVGHVGGLAGDRRDRDRRRRGLGARASAREAHRVGGAARSGQGPDRRGGANMSEIDLLVLGGGMAGMSAAARAAADGASVVLVEKGDAIGGSAAYAGFIWTAPTLDVMREVNPDADPALAARTRRGLRGRARLGALARRPRRRTGHRPRLRPRLRDRHGQLSDGV